ncbi:MAG: hypothetical protein Q9224_007751 [Gallowayella concinna]
MMMELVEGVGGVELDGSGEGMLASLAEGNVVDDANASQFPSSLGRSGGLTEAESDEEIDRDLNDAFDDMEIEEVGERAAGMVIADDDDDDDDEDDRGDEQFRSGGLRLTETEYAEGASSAAEQWDYEEL